MCRKCELIRTLDYSKTMDEELFEALYTQLMRIVELVEKCDASRMSEKQKLIYPIHKLASSLITITFFCQDPIEWDQETIWAAQLLAGETAVVTDSGVHEKCRLNGIADPATKFITIIARKADTLRAIKLGIKQGEFTPEKVAKIKLKQLGSRRKPTKDNFKQFDRVFNSCFQLKG